MKSLKVLCLILCVALLCAFAVACSDDNSATGSDKKPTDSSVVSPSSDKADSDTVSTDTPSTDTQSTASADGSSSSGNSNVQSGSSDIADTSKEQDSTISTPSTDSNVLTVYVESKQDGNTVTADIKIKNNPGLTAFCFELLYNKEELTPKKLTKVLVSVTSNLQQNQKLSGVVTLLYVDANGFSENGTLATVTFDVKDASKPLNDLRINATENSFLKLDGKTYVVDFVVK